jgi:NADPH-dependent F420 reductase
VIGFIGGTGPEGRGLALRFCMVGEHVLIGSRDPAKAAQAASDVQAGTGNGSVSGTSNDEAAQNADTIFIAVPYTAQRATLTALKDSLHGKVVVSVVAPLAFSTGIASALPVASGSAALETQALLPGSTVAAAFQTISAHDLLEANKPLDSDVIVCSDDKAAREMVMGLAEKISGVRAVDGGGLANAGFVENLTPLLLNLNRRYKSRSAIRITGI